MADRPHRVGQQLGNYRLISLLGEGGFAEVYLGEHIHLGTKAAVKVLHVQLTHEHVEAFRTEARTIAHLVHPHIVRVLEFGVEGTTPFLVMDYAPHGTLRNRHPKGSSLAIATIVSYIKQIANALQYAHDEKLIHRDIKPENMLVGRRNEVLLSDFGIALVAQSSHHQSTQQVMSSITYMSPEHIQGKPHPASDQYSLGIVVYEWLCGDRPFHGSFSEVCTQQMFAPPPSLREKLPTLSPDLEHVVMTALAKDPRQRFASVQAFATALEQASRQGPTQLPVSAITPPMRHPSRRMVIVGLVGLTLVGSGITWFTASRSSTSKPTLRMTPTPLSSIGTTLYTYKGHAHEVLSLAWSPDGKRIASGSNDNTVQVWDATNGGYVYTYPGHANAVYSVAWSPDGKRIASASASPDKTVQVWNAADGSHISTYKGHADTVRSVAWSPDGKHIASGSDDKTVQVWDAADGSHVYIYKGHANQVFSVAWSPDGKHIASGSRDTTVKVWEATDGSNPYTYTGHTDSVFSLAWSPDGKRIASASADKTVQVWNATNGSHVFTYKGHANQVFSVAWSPDGKRIASGSDDKTVQVWNAANGNHVYIYHGHSDTAYSVAWSLDGKRIASASWDKTVQVWVAS